MKKCKLDELLVKRGFIKSIDEAKRYIMAGKVLIEDIVIEKPGTLCDPNSNIRIKEIKRHFVSRAGDKLNGFLKNIDLKIENRCALDIGISTGGFSDVLLQKNALHVLGIDVGYGILDYKLRKHKRLSLLERTNAREVTEKDINKKLNPHHISVADISLVVMDVSFISVFKILPNLIELLPTNIEYIVLIKPQFEAKKEQVGLGGIINTDQDLSYILNSVEQQLLETGFNILKKEASSVLGTKGNQEYFYHIKPINQP